MVVQCNVASQHPIRFSFVRFQFHLIIIYKLCMKSNIHLNVSQSFWDWCDKRIYTRRFFSTQLYLFLFRFTVFLMIFFFCVCVPLWFIPFAPNPHGRFCMRKKPKMEKSVTNDENEKKNKRHTTDRTS